METTLTQRLFAWWFARPGAGRIAALALGCALALGIAALFPAAVRLVQEQGADLAWRLGAHTEPERRVLFVDIDDASLSQVGPWPWPRQTLADLTGRLDAAGVGLKLFDIVFPDGREGDAAFRQALSARPEAPSVLAQIFALRQESRLQSGALAGALPGIGCQAPAVPAQGYLANVQGLHPLAGHITPTLDGDGAVRRMAALVCMDDRLYPALALAGMAALDAGRLPAALQIAPGQGPWAPAWQLRLPQLGNLAVGVDEEGQIRIPAGIARHALASVSAADVLAGRVPAGVLEGAWVIVGASAFGLGDVVPTAWGGAVNGAEVHMQLLAGLLDQRVPATPRAAPWLQGAAIALAALALWALVHGLPLGRRRYALAMPVAAVTAAFGFYALHALALLQVQWFVGWVLPVLAVLCMGAALTLHEQARAFAEKRRIYQNLVSYVSAPVAERVALAAPSDEIEAERRLLSVVTADLGNFSRYCESREPEDAARVLHRFFSVASAIVQQHGGVVEELAGDGFVAVFNGSRACEHHPVQALRAARAIWQRCSEDLPNVHGLGLEPLSVNVGAETGNVMVGSFGPAQRRVHAVLGQAVTIALRLQDMTTDLAYPVLVGAGLAQAVEQAAAAEPVLALKPLGSFMLSGLQHSVQVHTLQHLLQPGGPAEQSTLRYLRQHYKQSAA